jgi:hypothetical protein
MVKPRVLPIAVGTLLVACTSGPHVMVLPGQGKTLDQFQADDAACRAWAAQQPGTTSERRYDMAYMQCMYTKGNQIPVTGGFQPSYTSPAPVIVPPPPAGAPPPPPGPLR